MGVGMAKQDSKVLKAATEQLATIAGQQPNVRRARKSIAAFKLREGMPVGVAVTLRGERALRVPRPARLDRDPADPRLPRPERRAPSTGAATTRWASASRSSSPRSTTTRSTQVRGLDITITTTAASDVEAFALLAALGMPFSPEGRPAGFDPEADAAKAAPARRGAGTRVRGERPPHQRRPTEPEPEPESKDEPAAEAAEPEQADEPAAESRA